MRYLNGQHRVAITRGLEQPRNVSPTIWNCAYCFSSPSFGPVFGAGADLCIASDCNSSMASYSNLPHSYGGQHASCSILMADYNFTVTDYEVFTAAPTDGGSRSISSASTWMSLITAVFFPQTAAVAMVYLRGLLVTLTSYINKKCITGALISDRTTICSAAIWWIMPTVTYSMTGTWEYYASVVVIASSVQEISHLWWSLHVVSQRIVYVVVLFRSHSVEAHCAHQSSFQCILNVWRVQKLCFILQSGLWTGEFPELMAVSGSEDTLIKQTVFWITTSRLLPEWN